MRHRIRSTSKTILAAFLLILAIVAGMFGYLAWTEYQRAKGEIDVVTSSRVQMVSTHAQWLVSASRQSFNVVELLVGESFPNVSAEKSTDISAIVNSLPGAANLSFLDLQGKTVFSTSKISDAPPLADYKDVLGASSDQAIHISVLSSADGDKPQSFVISRPVLINGQVRGIASLSFPVNEMFSLWSSVNLGPKSTIGLIRDDGWLVARYPAPDKAINLSDYVLFTEHLKKADRGVYSTESPVDEVRRVVAYRRVPNTPLIAVASADQEFMTKPMRTYFLSLATLLVGLLAVFGAVIYWTSNLLAEDDRRKNQLADSVEKSKLLLGEIHHRVKNNLQAVAALVQIQPLDQDVKRDMRLRIAAMAAVHEQSYALEQFAELDAKTYMETLISNAKKSYGQDIDFSEELTSMTISRDAALPLGLIVNEVISNAAKHAFKEQPEPSVRIKLLRLNQNEAQIVIHDNGIGYSRNKPSEGMGSKLIKAFAQQLNATYSIDSTSGALFKMTFPVPEKH